MNEKSKISLWQLFITFFKVGAFTIGGGMAMIPIIRKEMVEKQKWVDDKKIVDIFAISQSLPGVIAINSSMYIGYELAGIPGLLVSALGVTLPSFIIILVIAFFLSSIGGNVYLNKFFFGIRSAVVPLILLSAVKLSKSAIKDKFGIIIAVLSIIATLFFDIDVVFIVLFSGLIGYMYYIYNDKLKGGEPK